MTLAFRHFPSTAAVAGIGVIFIFRHQLRSSSTPFTSTRPSAIAGLSTSFIPSPTPFTSTRPSPMAGLSTSSIPLPFAYAATMDDLCPYYRLVLFGKSSQEYHFAHIIKDKEETLNLFSEGDEQGEIRVFLHSEIYSIDSPTFNAELYMAALRTERFGRLLIWSPRLPSTHDVVSKNFSLFPVGTACITDVQYKGRGRSKNMWESPVGCLMFSFTMEMEDGRKVPFLQYVVSLAATEAIKESCRAKGLAQIDIRIKWPNDLYLNGLKVGGILCTSTYSSKMFNVCAGIGLNLDNDKPTTCLNAAIHEMTSVSDQLGREDILAAFFNHFEKLFEVFLAQGFQALEELYYSSWLHSGQKVVIEEKQEGQVVNTHVTIQGLTSSGYLLATDEEHRNFELHPDGNSFDFFKGLVRRSLD